MAPWPELGEGGMWRRLGQHLQVNQGEVMAQLRLVGQSHLPGFRRQELSCQRDTWETAHERHRAKLSCKAGRQQKVLANLSCVEFMCLFSLSINKRC